MDPAHPVLVLRAGRLHDRWRHARRRVWPAAGPQSLRSCRCSRQRPRRLPSLPQQLSSSWHHPHPHPVRPTTDATQLRARFSQQTALVSHVEARSRYRPGPHQEEARHLVDEVGRSAHGRPVRRIMCSPARPGRTDQHRSAPGAALAEVAIDAAPTSSRIAIEDGTDEARRAGQERRHDRRGMDATRRRAARHSRRDLLDVSSALDDAAARWASSSAVMPSDRRGTRVPRMPPRRASRRARRRYSSTPSSPDVGERIAATRRALPRAADAGLARGEDDRVSSQPTRSVHDEVGVGPAQLPRRRRRRADLRQDRIPRRRELLLRAVPGSDGSLLDERARCVRQNRTSHVPHDHHRSERAAIASQRREHHHWINDATFCSAVSARLEREEADRDDRRLIGSSLAFIFARGDRPATRPSEWPAWWPPPHHGPRVTPRNIASLLVANGTRLSPMVCDPGRSGHQSHSGPARATSTVYADHRSHLGRSTRCRQRWWRVTRTGRSSAARHRVSPMARHQGWRWRRRRRRHRPRRQRRRTLGFRRRRGATRCGDGAAVGAFGGAVSAVIAQ